MERHYYLNYDHTQYNTFKVFGNTVLDFCFLLARQTKRGNEVDIQPQLYKNSQSPTKDTLKWFTKQ